MFLDFDVTIRAFKKEIIDRKIDRYMYYVYIDR